jgi:hypothetical protein
VACVSGKKEVEGVAQRVSGMKKENENIDCLLEQNADEQLSSFDWERLNKSISERLDEAGRAKITTIKYGRIFKIAAGIAIAAAAIVIIKVLVRMEQPGATQFENEGRAIVKIIENAGSATVEINQRTSETAIVVDTQINQQNSIVCNVEIINSNGDEVTNENRPTWIIIRVPEPVLVETDQSRDEADLACLL